MDVPLWWAKMQPGYRLLRAWSVVERLRVPVVIVRKMYL
jgi:hypothetical protein